MTKMFKNGSRLFLASALMLSVAAIATAQNREKYIISAKAGGVNSVYGYVTVLNHATGRQLALGSRDNLEAGDVVMTGSDGRVEVLLNPGTYLRVSENAEFNFEDTNLDHLKLRISKGSALIEATGDEGVVISLKVVTPQSTVAIVRHGIYRINVESSNTTSVRVQKGLAYLVGDEQTLVKSGHEAIVTSNSVHIEKSSKEKDALDVWSKQRAEYLAKANRRIDANSLASAFSGVAGDPWFNRWFFRTSFLSPWAGLWYWDPFFGGYTFLPPYGTGCSPYGYSYRGWPIGYGWRNAWPGGNPVATNHPPVAPDTGHRGKPLGPPKPVSSLIAASDIASATGRYGRPAFRGDRGDFPGSLTNSPGSSSGGFKGTQNVYQSIPSSAPPMSAPAPERSAPSVPAHEGGGKKP